MINSNKTSVSPMGIDRNDRNILLYEIGREKLKEQKEKSVELLRIQQ
jgi:hypothetical protein